MLSLSHSTSMFLSLLVIFASRIGNLHAYLCNRSSPKFTTLTLGRRTKSPSLSTLTPTVQTKQATFPCGTTRVRSFMFTGIVEEMGTVVSLVERNDMTYWDGSKGSGTEITIQANKVLEGAYLGCSICVSGVCLTATALSSASDGESNDDDYSNNNTKNHSYNTFKAGLAPETLRRTYFGSLNTGDAVNLERASEIGGRNSGHFVQGHVDGIGTVIERWMDEDSLWYKIQTSKDILQFIVPKGFIAVDGTSLTVVNVNRSEQWFTLMLVEYTQKKIVLPAKMVGAPVNLEVDVVGKYSEAALATLIPRIEALEAKIATLEQQLAAEQGKGWKNEQLS